MFLFENITIIIFLPSTIGYNNLLLSISCKSVVKNIVNDVALFSIFLSVFHLIKKIILFIDYKWSYWLKFRGLFFTWGLRRLHFLLHHRAGPALTTQTSLQVTTMPSSTLVRILQTMTLRSVGIELILLKLKTEN